MTPATEYRVNPGRMVVAILDALARRPMDAAELTREIFGDGDTGDPKFRACYSAVVDRLRRMLADGCVSRSKRSHIVTWKLVTEIERLT